MATITSLFPQLLVVSFFLLNLLSINYVNLFDIFVTIGSRRCLPDLGLLPGIGLADASHRKHSEVAEEKAQVQAKRVLELEG